MNTFVRAVSQRLGGIFLLLGGFLIFASASYACPSGQPDHCGDVSLIRIVASVVARLRPHRMGLSSPVAHNQPATRTRDTKGDRRAALGNDGPWTI
jgi:hypothetical protein